MHNFAERQQLLLLPLTLRSAKRQVVVASFTHSFGDVTPSSSRALFLVGLSAEASWRQVLDPQLQPRERRDPAAAEHLPREQALEVPHRRARRQLVERLMVACQLAASQLAKYPAGLSASQRIMSFGELVALSTSNSASRPTRPHSGRSSSSPVRRLVQYAESAQPATAEVVFGAALPTDRRRYSTRSSCANESSSS